MLDLALGAPSSTTRGLFLVAPGNREDEVPAQLARPAFSRVLELNVRYVAYGVRYVAYGDLEAHREAMAHFGEGLKAIEAIARALPGAAQQL